MAGDPPRLGRAHDRPARGERVPRPRGDRPTARMDRARARRARHRAVFPESNGAQRQRAMIAAGASREEVFAASVAETATDLRRGGDGVSGDQPGSQRAGPGEAQPERRGAARRLRGGDSPHHSADMIAQAAVSLLNIGGIDSGPPPRRAAGRRAERDLEQVRDAIDAVRGAAGDPRTPRVRRQLRPAARRALAAADGLRARGRRPRERARAAPIGRPGPAGHRRARTAGSSPGAGPGRSGGSCRARTASSGARPGGVQRRSGCRELSGRRFRQSGRARRVAGRLRGPAR